MRRWVLPVPRLAVNIDRIEGGATSDNSERILCAMAFAGSYDKAVEGVVGTKWI